MMSLESKEILEKEKQKKIGNRFFLFAGLAAIVLIALAVFFLPKLLSPVSGLPTSFPIAAGEVENQVRDTNMVTFTVKVEDKEAVEQAVESLLGQGYVLESENHADALDSYVLVNGETMSSVALETTDDTYRLLYAVSGPDIGNKD